MSDSCECCVLWGRGLCDGLITSPEESYRLWCVQWMWYWSLGNEKALADHGLLRHGEQWEMKDCEMKTLSFLKLSWNNSQKYTLILLLLLLTNKCHFQLSYFSKKLEIEEKINYFLTLWNT
jgi:hypothetical protein